MEPKIKVCDGLKKCQVSMSLAWLSSTCCGLTVLTSEVTQYELCDKCATSGGDLKFILSLSWASDELKNMLPGNSEAICNQIRIG